MYPKILCIIGIREKLSAMIVRFRDINAEKNLRFREYNGIVIMTRSTEVQVWILREKYTIS
jgi:hypothetical protein